MGVIAMSLTALACNNQPEENKEVKAIKAEAARIEKMSSEELAENINMRSYSLGANMGMGYLFQFKDLEISKVDLQDAAIDFYLNGDVEDEKLKENSGKFQMFYYTRVMPYMQAKNTREAMEAGGMTENLPEIPALYDEEYTKKFITTTLGSQMGASLIDVDGLSMGWWLKGFNDGAALNIEGIEEMDNMAAMELIDSQLLMTSTDIQMELRNLQIEMMEKQQEKMVQKAEGAKEASAQWLSKIEKKKGVVKTESGLLYRIDRQGNDVFATEDTDVVEVNYEGKTRDGKVFDSSYERGESISFGLNQVIKGWTEGMKLVGEGGQITLWIPSELAYGTRGAGQDIGPNEALEFKVELIKVTPAEVVEEE